MTFPAHTDPDTYRQAVVRDILPVRNDVRVLRLEPDVPLAFRAGQYIDIRFGDLPSRSYSIASAPGDSAIEIHIKRGKGEASRHVMDVLRVGDAVMFSGPHGHTLYDGSVTGPILALAGGLGVAPIRAMAAEAARAGRHAPFILLWSTEDDSEKYLGDYFRNMERQHGYFEFVPVKGRLDDALAARSLPDPHTWTVYISGPPDMISAMIPLLLEKGAGRAKIRYDRHPEAAKVSS